MNCKKCGFQLTENDQFCKNCGTPVDNTSVQNNNGSLNNQINQTYQELNMQQQYASQQPTNTHTEPTMNQTSWTNGYNAQPIKPTPKNSNTKFIIIGIIVAVAILGAIVAINVFKINKSNNSGSNNSGSSIVNNNKTSYTVKFEDFTFKIPTNLIYETKSNSIIIGDEEDTWIAQIGIVEGSYSKLLANKTSFQSAYQSDGYTSSVAVEKTIDGMSFITLELSKSGNNFILGFTKANSMNIFVITAYDISNECNYKILETISGILRNAEHSSTTNNISTFEKLDMSKIEDLAK